MIQAIIMSLKTINELSAFMNRDLAEGFIGHLKNRKITDHTVNDYARMVLRIIKMLSDKSPLDFITTIGDIASFPLLDGLGLQSLRNHYRHAW